jgi:hypothetical protein
MAIIIHSPPCRAPRTRVRTVRLYVLWQTKQEKRSAGEGRDTNVSSLLAAGDMFPPGLTIVKLPSTELACLHESNASTSFTELLCRARNGRLWNCLRLVKRCNSTCQPLGVEFRCITGFNGLLQIVAEKSNASTNYVWEERNSVVVTQTR